MRLQTAAFASYYSTRTRSGLVTVMVILFPENLCLPSCVIFEEKLVTVLRARTLDRPFSLQSSILLLYTSTSAITFSLSCIRRIHSIYNAIKGIMVWSVIQTLRHSLKYRGGWKNLFEHMYTVSESFS
jgi:hypothetical protein